MSILNLLDRPIAFNRTFVDLGVGITGALMLSQCVYWSTRTKDAQGWFYKTQSEWTSETGLTRREQETARKKLAVKGYLEEDRRGVPCKTFFRINRNALETDLLQLAQMRHSSMAESDKLDGENDQPSVAESAKQKCTKAPDSDGGMRPTIAETTAEITPETTQQDAPGASPADAPLEGEVEQYQQSDEPRVAIPADMPGPKDQSCKTFKAWANYAITYRRRYGVYPIWNGRIAGQMSQLVDRVGAEIAPGVAAYYLSLNSQYYVTKGHPVGLLLADCETIAMQMQTGQQMTATRARQMDGTQANASATDEAKRLLNATWGD